jgi:Family of unknown function (DUF6284)
MLPPVGANDGPTPADLADIDEEWPLIAAELALVDAEIAAMCAIGGPSELDRRRIRRAEADVARQAIAHAARRTLRRRITRAA